MARSWEQYRRASFRGVPFYWREGDDEVGRRVAVHTYPLRDPIMSEDLGKKAARIRMRAVVVGERFLEDANQLLRACQRPGPGLLVHPLLGSLRVICTACRASYTTARKGLVAFDLEFVEEGENRYPAANQDFARLAAEMAAAHQETFRGLLAEALRLAGPAWLRDSILADLGALIAAVEQAVRQAGATASEAAQVAAALGGVEDSLDQAQDEAALAAGLGGVMAALEGLAPSARFGAAVQLSSFQTQPVPRTTATRQTQADNKEAFQQTVRRLALTHGIQAAMDQTYASQREATQARDRLIEIIDDLMAAAAETGDDHAFEALRELLVAVERAFAQMQAPRTVQVELPPSITPALVLAYDRYQDITREADILARNPQVFHPGFLPAGEPLEVVADA
jgi:prophage DNA circulation protein